MKDSIKIQKKHLREIMLLQRDRMLQHQRDTLSEKICSELWTYISENNVQVIHSYLTMGSEVNILPLLQKALEENLTIIVPKTLKKRKLQNLILKDLKKMEVGIFGTYYPKDATEYFGEYDLIIVAGLAFDKKGYRVGYGGGYYDTFLAKQQIAKKVGVCYPFQFVENVPVEEHDIRLDKVVN